MTTATTRRWWTQSTDLGEIAVTLGPHGVERIEIPAAEHHVAEDAVDARDDTVAAALDAWCAGTSQTIDLTVDLNAAGLSPFHRTVLETLQREVGWGEVVTYGELAALAGRPGAARAVGAAMATNPLPFVIPCHRVVGSAGGGRRRIGGYGGGDDPNGVALKRRLLAREGVTLPD
jgi:methylated-DNA-[protein]-cysteine S-methyltransferase